MGVPIKRVMEKDEKGVDRQVYPVTHIDAIAGLDNLTEDRFEDVVIESDLKNKIAGSNIENPHNLRYQAQPNLLIPTANWYPSNQTQLSKVAVLDGNSFGMENRGNGNIAQVLISWNILEIIVRNYPELKGISVANLKQLLKKVSVNLWAKGSSSLGNKAYYKLWVNGNEWGGTITNNSSALSKISYIGSTPSIINAYITNDGFIYALLHADPSDGATASSAFIDYGTVEITLRMPVKQKVPSMKQFNELVAEVEKLKKGVS